MGYVVSSDSLYKLDVVVQFLVALETHQKTIISHRTGVTVKQQEIVGTI